jgi:hypothetical protein
MPQVSSTQQFVDIAGIREGIIVLKNGAYRLILSTSAVNFSLKSEQEQNSLVFQYQSFLNSLHFPIQIVIQSKKLDLNQYLKKLTAAKEKQQNELLRLQMEDYSEFVSQLINVANIMKKNFYVVVSYDPISITGGSVIDKLFKKSSPTNLKISDQDFKRYKDELVERANVVASGLGSMGIRCVQLNTEEIIELFYKIYNPEMADKERFEEVGDITSSVVINKNEAGLVKPTPKISEEEVSLIDNGTIVEEQQKSQIEMSERENSKEAEKQIVEAGAKEETATKPVVNNNQNPAAATNPTTAPAGQPAAQNPAAATNPTSQTAVPNVPPATTPTNTTATNNNVPPTENIPPTQ